MLENYRIILGSQSPRRKELLAGLDIKFETLVKTGEEIFPHNLKGDDIPLFLAKQKADAYNDILSTDANAMIITADTIVWLDNKMYGKPHSKEEAVTMLHELSGKTHQVITGVCVRTQTREESFSVESEVTFGSLTDEEINHYISKYKPYDKAGSYGIQEWIGYIGVESINGSYFNIMGLPVQRLYQVLKTF